MSVDVDAIKASTPLPATIERLTGQEITRRKIRCPFHDDSTPSLHVYDDGGWKCYGCGKHGDVLDFIGYYMHGELYRPEVHFTDVIDSLGALEIKPAPRAATKSKPPKPKPKIELDTIMRWHERMPDDRRAWWHGRGLTDQTIKEFFLGWDGERYIIPALYRLIPFGIKRRVAGDVHDYSPDVKYIWIGRVNAGIFNADTLWNAHSVIVCEGEIDAMLLEQSGYRAVCSTGGTGTFKPEWAQHFSHVRQVYTLFDNDKAGREGAARVRRVLRRAKNITLPDGINDVGDLYQQWPAPSEWLFENVR